MLSAFGRAFRTPDLRRKLLFTLAMIGVYRLGSVIPGPGVSYVAIQTCLDQVKDNSVYGLVNLFSGGALLQLSVFALGIMPYITSSIIIQLLIVVIPRLETLKQEGQSGQAKLTQYTRYLTVALAILQSTGIVALARSGQPDPGLQREDHPGRLAVAHRRPGRHADRRHRRDHVARRARHRPRHRQRHVRADLHLDHLLHAVAGRHASCDQQRRLRARRGAAARARRHHLRGLRRAGPAPHPRAVRQAHGRPEDVRRDEHLHPAEGQPGRRHPRHLRQLAAVPAEPPAQRVGQRGAAEVRRPLPGARATTRSTSASTSA